MVPWKIVNSAGSLLNFMSALGVFLAPIAAIMACDYWVVKRHAVDVPALYRSHARYRYNSAGTNWRALVALLISVGPNLPGLANAGLSFAFPAKETLIPEAIHEDVVIVDGVEKINDGLHQPVILEKGADIEIKGEGSEC